MSQSLKTSGGTAPLVALAGWVVPGAGYWLLGERSRSLTVGITILLMYFAGCLIGGVRVVEAPSGGGSVFGNISQKPWFVGQVLMGPIALATAWESSNLAANPATHDIVAHSRIAEIATLYTAVAGMLNLLAIIDASYRAGQEED